MRRNAWLLLFMLVAPAAAQQPAEETPDCVAEGAGFFCEWTFETGPRANNPRNLGEWTYRELPVTGSMIVTATVRLEGDDHGWELWLQRYPKGESEILNSTRSVHKGTRQLNAFATETAVMLATSQGDDAHVLWLLTGDQEGVPFSRYSEPPVGSRGTFTVVALVEPLPAGASPERPAATRDDPHVGDLARDARRPELDILAFWLDDAAVGDRLFDAHLAIVANASPDVPTSVSGDEGFILWKAGLSVGESSWELWWFARGPAEVGCNFRRVVDTARPIIGFPTCDLDFENGQLNAVLPEGFLEDPGTGVPIKIDFVRSETSTSSLVGTVVEDESAASRYDFALGGPDVWSDLNPRLDPIVTKAAWYQDPLASDNIPDTLSVAGALLAAVTFLAGTVVVQRNRRRTREILDRVDALVRAHEADHRGALRALGDLESDFDRLYRERRINEAQYQLAQQRIVAAASRLALRKELGLDDGEPG